MAASTSSQSGQNRYGLSRYIPADVARQVRQNSKFGCVVCRCAIYQYEHITPTFDEATAHDPAHICLLCGACHDRVTRGQLSKETVASAYNQIRDRGGPPPFSEFDLAHEALIIDLGLNQFVGPSIIFQIDGESMLEFSPPEIGASLPSLSGKFMDEHGAPLFTIERNVWNGPIDRWDVEVNGRNIIVRNAPGKIALHIEVRPPNALKICRLVMVKGASHIVIDKDLIIGRQTTMGTFAIGVSGFHAVGAAVCVSVDTKSDLKPNGQLHMIGGKGIQLEGTGIALGVGAAQMHINALKLWMPRNTNQQAMT